MTFIFLSQTVFAASHHIASLCVEDDSPGSLSGQAAIDVLLCLTYQRE